MLEFQKRVIAEKQELDARLLKLIAFIGTEVFLSLDLGEQDRLERQAEAMTAYSTILGERITANGWDIARNTIQMVRNIKTGLVFAATPDLLRYARNRSSNLEVIEVEAPEVVEETMAGSEEETDVQQSSPPVDPESAVVGASEETNAEEAGQQEKEGAPGLSLDDGPGDDFPAPPRPPARKNNRG